LGFIYKITNNYDDNVYIGQTRNKPQDRWGAHKGDARNGHKSFLYNAMRKHGIENFSFEVIEEVDDERLNEREIYWISQFDSFHNGYNLTLGGGGFGHIEESEKAHVRKLWDEGKSFAQICSEVNMSPTSIQKVLWAHDGYSIEESKRRGYQISRSYTPVAQYDNDGNFVAIYRSISEAAKINNLRITHIGESVRKPQRRAGGFRWRFVEDDG